MSINGSWESYLREWLTTLVHDVGGPESVLGTNRQLEVVDTGTGLRLKHLMSDVVEVFFTADDGPDLVNANLETMTYIGEIEEFAFFNSRSTESEVWIAQDRKSHLSISLVTYFEGDSQMRIAAADAYSWFERSTSYARSNPLPT